MALPPSSPTPSGTITPFLPLLNVFLSAGIAWLTAKWVAKKNVKKQAFNEILDKLDELEDCAEALLLTAGNAPEAAEKFRAVTRLDRRLGVRLTELFRAHPSKSRLAGPDPVPPPHLESVEQYAFHSLRRRVGHTNETGLRRQ